MQETAKMKVIIFFIFLGYYTTYKYNKFLINNDKFRLIAIFSSTEVTKVNGEWSYKGDARYWLYGRKHYFAAIAPSFAKTCPYTVETVLEKNATDVLGELTLTNTGDTDLMYSSYMREAGIDNEKGPVNFKFYHLLSKIYISFENLVDPNVDLAVSNIQINGIGSASIDLRNLNGYTGPSNDNPANYWTSKGKDNDFKLADIKVNAKYNKKASTENLFLIPSPETYSYTISFDITLKMKGVDEILYKVKKTGVVSGTPLYMGCAYNFATKITPNTIKEGEVTFEVAQIKDHWGNDLSKVFDDSDMILISSKLGGDVTLSADETTITSSVNVVDDLTINLNGKKLNYGGNNWLFNVYDDGFDGYDSENDQVINDVNNKTVLTINGDGEISTTGACIATASTNSEIYIKGGVYKTKGATLYKSIGGDIYIKRGEYKAEAENSNNTFLRTSGNIYVSGGSFYNWNPATEVNGRDFLANINPDKEEFIINKEAATQDSETGYWYVVKKRYTASSSGDISAALEDEDVCEIVFDKQIVNTTSSAVFERDIIIDMNGELYQGLNQGSGVGSLVITGADNTMTIKNANLTGRGLFAMFGAQLVYEGGTAVFNFSSSSQHGFYAAAYPTDETSIIRIKGGDFSFKSDSSNGVDYICAHGNAIVYVEGGNFGKMLASNKSPISTVSLYGVTGQVIITGGTFAWDPSNWVASGYTATPSGTKWIVSKNVTE